MTADVIALCRTRPDVESQVEAFDAVGPDVFVAAWQDSPVVLLLDAEQRVLLAVDGARLVQVPSEVRRLLQPSPPEVTGPVWWVEVRASSTHDDALAAARRVAETLVERHGGTVWPAAS